MTAASSSVLGKRFTPSPNSAFSHNPNEKRQKTVGEMARAAMAQPRQSKWIVQLGRNYWEQIFTYLRDPNQTPMLHSEFLPLAGTCHKLRTWVANMATKDIMQSLKRYRDFFDQIHGNFDARSPVHAQAIAARGLVYNLLQEHGISGFRHAQDQLIRPILKDTTNISHIGTLIRAHRYFPFRLLSLNEVVLFHEQMMQTWNVETSANAQAQWRSFAARKLEPRELIQLELLLDLAGHRHDFSSLGIPKIIAILRNNPEALQCMVHAGVHAKTDSQGYTFIHYLAAEDMPQALEAIACSSLKKELFLRSQKGFHIVGVAIAWGALKTIFWSLKHEDPEIKALCFNLFPDESPGASIAHIAANLGQVKVLEALAKDPEAQQLLLKRDATGRTIWDHGSGKTVPNRESVLKWIRETQLVKHLMPAQPNS